MEKVYCDEKNQKCWLVNDVDDIYSFKYKNIETGEEKTTVLTHTKPTDEKNLIEDVKYYSLDFNDVEVIFYVKYEDGKIGLHCLDLEKLEELKNNEGIVFIGDHFVNEN